jgi:hypothetical protein
MGKVTPEVVMLGETAAPAGPERGLPGWHGQDRVQVTIGDLMYSVSQ